VFHFFFQAEDGIRDFHVTGVQTCALPIFAEEVAELVDRHRLYVVLVEVGLHELREREPPCDPALSSKPLELTLERIARVLLGGEPTALDALRVAPAGAVAVGPQPLTVGAAARQFECLSLLHHRLRSSPCTRRL